MQYGSPVKQSRVTRKRRELIIGALESRGEMALAEVAEASGYRPSCLKRVLDATNLWFIENRDRRRIRVDVRGSKHFWRMVEKGGRE
jgi:hypothetical protein